ncbi:MAG: hypothetical protein AAB425_05985, partial [Bdellovibrionota bacterium]
LNPLLAESNGAARFDEGVDTSEVLKDLKKRVNEDKVPAPQSKVSALSRISGDLILSPRFALKGPPVSISGWVFGPWQQFILNDPNRPEALEILPRLEALPPEVRDPLKKRWAEIEAVRSGLLSDAVALERIDSKLFDDGTALDRQAEELERQGDRLRQEIRDFNDACVDRPLPPDQHQRCLRWQADLKARISQYNQKVENHNLQVEAWKRRAFGDEGQSQSRFAGGVRGDGALLNGRISSWGRTIPPYVDAAKKALANVAPPGKCVLLKIERNSDGRAYNCKARCNRAGAHVELEFRPFPSGKPCGVDEGDLFTDPGVGSGAIPR